MPSSVQAQPAFHVLTPRATQEWVESANKVRSLAQRGTSTEEVSLEGRIVDALTPFVDAGRGPDTELARVDAFFTGLLPVPGPARPQLSPGLYLQLPVPTSFVLGKDAVTTSTLRLASSGNELIGEVAEKANEQVRLGGHVKLWKGEAWLYLNDV